MSKERYFQNLLFFQTRGENVVSYLTVIFTSLFVDISYTNVLAVDIFTSNSYKTKLDQCLVEIGFIKRKIMSFS